MQMCDAQARRQDVAEWGLLRQEGPQSSSILHRLMPTSVFAQPVFRPTLRGAESPESKPVGHSLYLGEIHQQAIITCLNQTPRIFADRPHADRCA